MIKKATTTYPVHEYIQNRWSPRAFDANKTIADSLLMSVLEAAHWAPSCMNEQPWRYLVCVKAQQPEAWQTLLNCLGEKNQQWAVNAPILILAVAMDYFNNTDKLNRWAAYDTGASCLNLCLQATALGLVTHQIGGFDIATTRSAFALPINVTPMSVIALGYQAEASLLPELLQEKELADRQRAPINQRFWFGNWQSY